MSFNLNSRILQHVDDGPSQSDARRLHSCHPEVDAGRDQIRLAELRVNVSKDQSRYKQGSVDLADFHRGCSVFHADSHGAIRFS